MTADSVDTAQLRDNSINSQKIRDGSIQTNDIADGAISREKIAFKAITPEKIVKQAFYCTVWPDGTAVPDSFGLSRTVRVGRGRYIVSWLYPFRIQPITMVTPLVSDFDGVVKCTPVINSPDSVTVQCHGYVVPYYYGNSYWEAADSAFILISMGE
ncbi:hypothetical protein HK102_003216 [Quaeritorhiza haematococci]|nr:hypothetical protein HK102_003216 [Quaeritorhiza haematococci]